MHDEVQMNNLLSKLLLARSCAHVHHWRVKSLALHLALGELYEQLTEFMDELAEMYMGLSSTTVNPDVNDPNGFEMSDPVLFVQQLMQLLTELNASIPQDKGLLNRYEELLGVVQRIAYKVKNLK